MTNLQLKQLLRRYFRGQGNVVQVADHLTLTLSQVQIALGAAAPTLLVRAWGTAGETSPFAGTINASYGSSNHAVATVDALGVITLVGAGTVTFSVTDSVSRKTASSQTLTVTAFAGVFSALPASVDGSAPGGRQQITATLDGVDILSRCTFSTDTPSVATVDEPSFRAILPATIAQGDTDVPYQLTGGENLKTGQTLTGLPTGVTASSLTAATDGQSATAELTASGSATTGAATLKVHDATHGDSSGVAFNVTSASGAGGLHIQGGNFDLIMIGSQDIVVWDDSSNPVTGCDLIISDPAKAASLGQRLVGLGASGTFTVKARKTGFTDSSTITVTCTGSVRLISPRTGIGTPTDQQEISTITDSNGNVFTGSGVYRTSGINNAPYIIEDGISDHFDCITDDWNAPSFYEVIVFRLRNTPASTQALVAKSGTGATTGYIIQIGSTQRVRAVIGNGSGFGSIGDAGTAIDTVNRHVIGVYCDGTAFIQRLYLDGVLQASGTVHFVDNTGAVTMRMFVTQSGTSNYAGLDWYARIKVLRLPTDAERAQLDLTAANW